jgi:hypothetical protein
MDLFLPHEPKSVFACNGGNVDWSPTYFGAQHKTVSSNGEIHHEERVINGILQRHPVEGHG